jgi:hypothetical protein
VLNAIAAGESAGEHKAARIQSSKINTVVKSCEEPAVWIVCVDRLT